MWERLKKSKTFWSALAGVAANGAGVAFDLSAEQITAMNGVILSLLAIFIKDAVAKR